MSTDTDNFPIFLQFTEQQGDKTEALIDEIKRLSQRFDIYEDVTLAAILPSKTGADENSIVYQINTSPTINSPKSTYTIDFLEYIFQKMFDKYPSYVEPIE